MVSVAEFLTQECDSKHNDSNPMNACTKINPISTTLHWYWSNVYNTLINETH